MGILDLIQSVTGQGNAATGANAQAAGGLLEALQSSPGGLGGLLQSLQQNGLGDQVQQWGSGQTAPADPSHIDQALGNSGLIDTIAQKTGMSPAMVKTGLAVAVPVLVHHLIAQGHVDAQGNHIGEQPEAGGLLQSVLGRLV